MKRIRIILEYLLGFLLVISLLIAIAGVVVVRFYGEEVKERVVRDINSKIDTKVFVDKIHISVFRKFPFTTVVLNDFTVWSSHAVNRNEFEAGFADTLLHADAVFLKFNLFDLVRKDFSIRQFEARNGSLKILTDSKGEQNYRLLKEQKEVQNTENDMFILNEVAFFDFECIINNVSKELNIAGHINELKLNGNYNRNKYQIRAQADLDLDEILNKDITYASRHTIKTRIHLDVKDSLYQFENGLLQVDRISAQSAGNIIIHEKEGITLNIEASAMNVDFNALTDIIPDVVIQKAGGLKGSGKIDIEASASGMLSSTRTPAIKTNFSFRNGSLSSGPFPFAIEDLSFEGSYTNGRLQNPLSSTITLKHVSAKIDKNTIRGNILISNLYNPRFNLDIQGSLDPGTWVEWYKPAGIQSAGGEVLPDVSIEGTVIRETSNKRRSLAFNVNGMLTFKALEFQLAHCHVGFENIHGSVAIDHDVWEPSLKGNYGDSDFRIEGTGLNLLSYLQQKQPLVISADFYSETLDLHQILQSLPVNSERKKTGMHFPDDLFIRLNYSISDFSKDRFAAKNLRGTATYESPLLFVDSIYMQTLDGTLSGNLAMVQEQSTDILTNVSANLSGLNIRELFYAFNNFGQDQITQNNLKGNVSGSSEFAASFSNSFKIRTESIISKNEVVIRNGELIDFEPLMALSRFVDVKELEDIRFSTLQNTVLIRDNQVVIPQMDIQSNAINLSASGTQGLNKVYEYRVKLRLSELLYQKSRKTEDQEFAVAQDSEDTRTLFLKIYNNGDEVKVEYDRERAAEKIREDLSREKTELKHLLNEELGWFKKEHGDEISTKPDDKEQPLFRFEFPDEGEDTVQKDSAAGREKLFKRRRERPLPE